MGYYSLKVPIHNNDVINNSSLGLITCNESVNQQFCFIFHLFWTNERGKGHKNQNERLISGDYSSVEFLEDCFQSSAVTQFAK